MSTNNATAHMVSGGSSIDVQRRAGRRHVRVLAGARFASTGGSQAAQMALAFVVYERTGSAAWVSACLLASAGVVGLFGPVSGRLSDRFNRLRVMVFAEVAGALGWLGVLLADSPTMLILAALAATAANAPFRAACSAAVPNLVPDLDLTWANGALATAVNASLIVGPLVGGMLIGVVGAHTVFALNACTFLLSAILIGRLPQGVSQSNKSVGPARPMCGRWTAILREPGRRSLIAITALSYAAFGVTLVADLPLVDHFGAGALGYALLTTLWGVGAVLGSRLATRIDARHETLAVLCGTAAMGLALGSIAAMPNLTGAVAVGTIGGLGSGIAFTPWFSLLQRATDDSERGTAFAIAETFEQMAFVVGMVVAGVAVGVLGPQLTYLLPAALLAVASLCAFRLVRGTRSD